MAHGSVGEAVAVTDADDVVEGAMHEQALERRKNMSPFWFSLQAFEANVGIAVGAILVAVKVAQKD